MLQGAVRDLRPADGVLDHLHRAVLARRARRRQAVVGTAAAALLIGTAVPAFVHVATSNDASTARPAIAGHGEQAQGGNGDGAAPDAPDLQTAEPTDRRSEGVTGEADPDPSPTKGEGGDPDGTATAKQPDPSAVDYAMLPVCDPGQLGVASAGTGAPGADGTVYGSFKIANVSGKDCTVSSNGTVGFTALGAADPLKIGVVQHAAGDAAPRPARSLAGAGHGGAEADHGVRGALRLGALGRHLSHHGPVPEPDPVGGRRGRLGRRRYGPVRHGGPVADRGRRYGGGQHRRDTHPRGGRSHGGDEDPQRLLGHHLPHRRPRHVLTTPQPPPDTDMAAGPPDTAGAHCRARGGTHHWVRGGTHDRVRDGSDSRVRAHRSGPDTAHRPNADRAGLRASAKAHWAHRSAGPFDGSLRRPAAGCGQEVSRRASALEDQTP